MKWTPALLASVAWHLGVLLSVSFVPSAWRLAVTALLANHGLVAAASFLPRTRLLGPNLRRLPAARAECGDVALTFDDGPDPEVSLRVADVLEKRSARATFFCVGARVEAHPHVVRELVDRGHRVENHTHRHPASFAFWGPRRMSAEIDRAQVALRDATGYQPRYFRAPAGFRGPLLAGVLEARDLELVSWTRRGLDTLGGPPTRVVKRLTDNLQAGDILLLHDGVKEPRAAKALLDDVLPPLLDHLDRRGLQATTLPDRK